MSMVPDDATHVGPGGQAYRQIGRVFHSWNGNWWAPLLSMPNCVEIKRPWNGEGLPPVGTVCEYKGAGHYLDWSEVKIFAVWGNQVFVDYGSGWRAEKDADRFRPIRTAEQIAADDTMADMKRIVEAALHLNPRGGAGVQALYDAGYRKQPAPKERSLLIDQCCIDAGSAFPNASQRTVAERLIDAGWIKP